MSVMVAAALLLGATLLADCAVAASYVGQQTTTLQWPTPMPAPIVNIATLGAKPDNKTSNTAIFRAAVATIEKAGGGTLLVPEGTWLTGPFNLTSNLTLYLKAEATIQGSTDMAEWPLMPAMKSYGQGRDHAGPRHISLLHGFNLQGLTIGGENGTVDGGGPFWWARHRSGVEQFTRGHLFECLYCEDLLFQDVTFTNSPFWTVHPVFSNNVVARRLTVLNDHYSPNTDGFVSQARECQHDVMYQLPDEIGPDLLLTAVARGIHAGRIQTQRQTCSLRTASSRLAMTVWRSNQVGTVMEWIQEYHQRTYGLST